MQARHGLATISVLLMVRHALHGFAAPHRLMTRGHANAISTGERESDAQYSDPEPGYSGKHLQQVRRRDYLSQMFDISIQLACSVWHWPIPKALVSKPFSAKFWRNSFAYLGLT